MMDTGIISGADGPTTIFLCGGPAGFILVLMLPVAAAGAAVWFFRRRHRN